MNVVAKKSTVTGRVYAKAFELLEQHPEGIHWSELLSKIKASDSNLHPKTVNGCIWKLIEKFAPFGVANPKPTFLFKNVQLAQVRYFGKERTHLELSLSSDLNSDSQGRTLPDVKAITFFAKESKDEHGKHGALEKGSTVDLIATMEVNTFRNKRELRLRIVSVVQK